MSIRRHWPSVFWLLILAGALGWSLYEGPEPPLAVALLLPAEADTDDPRVAAWHHAAQAEELPLVVIRDDAFLRPTRRKPLRLAGVIVPDTLHPGASGILIDQLQTYVEQGGKLMVVYDAATLSPPGHVQAVRQSHLTKLVGIDYAVYGHQSSPAGLTLSADPAETPRPLLLAWLHSTAKRDEPTSLSILPFTGTDKQYAHLVGTGSYRGLPLLKGSDDSLMAGLHRLGRGQVAFVNLALGELGARSDPAILQLFLRWFGHVCGLSTMSASGAGAENGIDQTSSIPLGGLESPKMSDHGRSLSWESAMGMIFIRDNVNQTKNDTELMPSRSTKGRIAESHD